MRTDWCGHLQTFEADFSVAEQSFILDFLVENDPHWLVQSFLTQKHKESFLTQKHKDNLTKFSAQVLKTDIKILTGLNYRGPGEASTPKLTQGETEFSPSKLCVRLLADSQGQLTAAASCPYPCRIVPPSLKLVVNSKR